MAGAARWARRLEREWRWWWRAVLLDVVAFRVARATHERSEAASSLNEDAGVGLAALRAGLRRRRLARAIRPFAGDISAAAFRTRQLPRFLVFGIHRAGQELAEAAQPDDHRMAFGANLIRRPSCEVRPLQFLGLLIDRARKGV